MDSEAKTSNTPPSYDPKCMMCNLRRQSHCLKCHELGLGHACPRHQTPCGKHDMPPELETISAQVERAIAQYEAPFEEETLEPAANVEPQAEETFFLPDHLALRDHLAEHLEAEGGAFITEEQAQSFEQALAVRFRAPGAWALEDFIEQHGLTTAAAKPIILRFLELLASRLKSLSTSKKPVPFFPDPAAFPREMPPLVQHLGFIYKWNGHKWKKPPRSTRDGSRIGGTEKHRSHFQNLDDAIRGAVTHRLDGVGIALDGTEYVGIDFDDAVVDGKIRPEAEQWLKFFPGAYIEFSPSHTGFHIICRGTLAKALVSTPLRGADPTHVEAYSSGRYFTLTGRRIGPPVEVIQNCQEGIDYLLRWVGEDHKPAAEAETPEGGTKKARHPLPAGEIRKKCEDACQELREAKVGGGNGNALTNKAAFVLGQAYPSGVLEKTEEQLKKGLFEIVTKKWTDPMGENEARETIKSGWEAGVADPFTSGILCGPRLLDEIVRAAEKVLVKSRGKYYESNRRLVMPSLARGIDDSQLVKAKKDTIERDDASVILSNASKETIDRDLDKHGCFLREQSDRGKTVHLIISPPSALSRHLLERCANYPGEVPYSHLDMLVNTPVLLESGEVHDRPGELRDGVLFLAPSCEYPLTPDRPTRDDALTALKKFEAIFGQFPFVRDQEEGQPWQKTAAYSVVLASCLTIAARSALQVAVPLIAIKAPKPRSGKTKIADAATRAMLGHKPTTIYYRNEEEFGKTLLPLLLHQDRVVLIDNIAQPFRSSKFAPLITNNHLTDRWLGRSEDITLYNRAVFFATGNNLLITGDLAWRSLLVAIDANVEHPENRRFAFQPEVVAAKHHPELVVAALTALRAYILADRPWSLPRPAWGGFEKWDQLITGCLTWLGYADPKETCQMVIEDDPERKTNVGLLATWYEEFGPRPMRLEEIQKNSSGKTYQQLLGAKGEWAPREIAWRFRNLRDRVEGGYKLVKGKGPGGKDVGYWKVVRVAGGESRDLGRGTGDQGRMPF